MYIYIYIKISNWMKQLKWINYDIIMSELKEIKVNIL